MAPSSPTSPRLVTLTPATLAPALPSALTPLTIVSYVPGILEAMPYADLPQAPSPPLSISEADDFVSTARTTAKEIRQAVSLQDFFVAKQQITLGALPEVVTHPAAILLQSYLEEGIPFTTGLLWSRRALDEAIHNGPHASACAPDMVSFIWGELWRRIQDGFSIPLSAEDTL